jgi:hypothetical protein
MSANKRWLLLLMSAFVLTAGVARGAVSLSAPKRLVHAAHQVPAVRKSKHVNPALIRRYRAKAWRWQALMGRAPTRRAIRPGTRSLLRYWTRAAAQAYVRAIHPPHKGAWLCIHRYEGSWNDPDPPYYGGLQMDVHFQRTYAPTLFRLKGTADHWTPLEQMWAAERAHRSGRGFYPWPNTARYCGLI